MPSCNIRHKTHGQGEWFSENTYNLQWNHNRL